MRINNLFKIEQIVFLITDKDQQERMVTEICVTKTHLLYKLMQGSTGTWHNEYEICAEKNQLTQVK